MLSLLFCSPSNWCVSIPVSPTDPYVPASLALLPWHIPQGRGPARLPLAFCKINSHDKACIPAKQISSHHLLFHPILSWVIMASSLPCSPQVFHGSSLGRDKNI